MIGVVVYYSERLRELFISNAYRLSVKRVKKANVAQAQVMAQVIAQN